jgi:transcriptional regulator with GAF, ATPase, and Fis domain
VIAQVAGGMSAGSAQGFGPGREVLGGGMVAVPGWGAPAGGVEPMGLSTPPNTVTITPGMTMVEVEKAVILATLRETRGNRRKAAEILDIGERTLYRKLKEYHVPDRFGE